MFDRELKVAYGNSRDALVWANKVITFHDLCERLKVTIRTSESAEEYRKMQKPQRDAIKDKGGLVGGYLRDNRRKIDKVVCRSMAILDVDTPDSEFLDRYRKEHRYASVLYSTHSHTAEAARYRLIIPYTRDITRRKITPSGASLQQR